jgi:hypothetical protein
MDTLTVIETLYAIKDADLGLLASTVVLMVVHSIPFRRVHQIVVLAHADVIAVLDDLGIDKTDYWGSSLSGVIGFALAERCTTNSQSLPGRQFVCTANAIFSADDRAAEPNYTG